MIKDVLNLLSNSKIPTSTEIKESFDEVIKGIADEINAVSLISLFNINKFDDLLITSAIEAIKDSVSKVNLNKSYEDIIEFNSVKYNDDFSYLYLASDIILSCVGLNVVRSFENIYSNLFQLYSNVSQEDIFNNKDFFEKTGIYLNTINENDNYYKYLDAIKKTLKFDNILTLFDCFSNVANAKNLYLGVDNAIDFEKLAKIAINLKYSNAIIINNPLNYPFVVLDSENTILEAWKNKIFSYKLTSDLFEITPCSVDELRVLKYEDALKIVNNLFKNKIQDKFFDFVTLNSSLAVYISKKAPSLYDAFNLVKDIILSGRALEKFEIITK